MKNMVSAFLAALLFSFAFVSQGTCELDRPDFSKIAPHPRLYFPKGGETAQNALIRENPFLLKIHDGAIAHARGLLKKPLIKRVDEGMRMRSGGEASNRMNYLGYAWRMTKNPVFAENAKKNLEALMKFDDWNTKHFLDTSAMCEAFAVANDWFYDAFDDTFKKQMFDAVKKFCFDAFHKKKYWFFYDDPRVNNWNQVCCEGMLAAAISFYEINPAECGRVIDEMLFAIQNGLNDCYSKKGMYLEGSSYWSYGAAHQFLFGKALETAFGSDMGIDKNFPNEKFSAEFVNHLVGTSKLNFSYSDSGEPLGISTLMFCYAQKLGDPTVLWYQKDFVVNKKFNAVCGKYFPILMFAQNVDFSKITCPQNNYWADNNEFVPIFCGRTGWNCDDLYLGIKGGKAASSHGHMDGGGFVFDAFGQRWAFDLGAQNYYSLEKLGMKIWSFKQNSDRWKVLRYSNFSHNILTVNDALINAHGFAKMLSSSENPNKFGATFDTSPLYAPALKSATRHAYVIDGKFLSVCDSIETASVPAKIRWNVCTLDTAKILDTKTIQVVSPNGKKLLIKLVSPQNFIAKIKPAVGEKWDSKNKGRAFAGFEGEVPPNSKAEIKVEMLPQQ